MNIVDKYFNNKNINIEDEIVDILRCFHEKYFYSPELVSKNYLIPGREEDNDCEYYRLPLDNKIIPNFFNAVALKSDYAAIKELREVEETLEEAEYDKIGFAFHGNYMIVNNRLEDSIINLRYSEIPMNINSLHPDIVRYIKVCYYHAYTGSWDSFYEALNNLSNAKSENVISKNLRTDKDRRTNQIHIPRMFRL